MFTFQLDNAKGPIISKWFFGVFDFLQKTNENKSTWVIIEVKSNSFVRFLEEIEDTKNPSKIIWPLRGKHCRHPIAVMGVVGKFGQWKWW